MPSSGTISTADTAPSALLGSGLSGVTLTSTSAISVTGAASNIFYLQLPVALNA